MVMGSPGKVKRAVNEAERELIQMSADNYVEYAALYRPVQQQHRFLDAEAERAQSCDQSVGRSRSGAKGAQFGQIEVAQPADETAVV